MRLVSICLFPLRRSNYIPLQVGKHYTIEVTASSKKAADSTRKQPLDVRKCLFPDEATEVLSFFKIYSKSACQLECSLKAAYKICKCVPWNYLHFRVKENEFGLTELCDMEGNTCFEKAMDAMDSGISCSCWPSCAEVTYSYNVISTPLEVDKFCKSMASRALKALAKL